MLGAVRHDHGDAEEGAAAEGQADPGTQDDEDEPGQAELHQEHPPRRRVPAAKLDPVPVGAEREVGG